MTRSDAESPLVAFADLARASSGFDSDRGVLVGSRCERCAAIVYPRASVCFQCRSSTLDDLDLTSEGILQSFTRVRVSSSREVPYAIGYVDLPEGVRILAPLRDTDDLACDAPVRLSFDSSEWSFEVIQERTAHV